MKRAKIVQKAPTMLQQFLLIAGVGTALISVGEPAVGKTPDYHRGTPLVKSPLGSIDNHKYRYVDLGPGEFVQINEAGTLMVICVGGLGSLTEIRTPGHTVVLPPLGEKYTRIGASISDQGDVTGEVGSRYLFPAIWHNHKLQLVGGFTFQSKSMAIVTGISDSGVMCGSLIRFQGPGEAVTFTQHSFTRLQCPPDTVSSFVRGTTRNGIIVGSYEDSNKHSHAIIWRDRRYTVLAPLRPYKSSEAVSGNVLGWIVGASGDSNMSDERNIQSATIWKNGQPLALKSLGGTNSSAMFINNAGWIVGSSRTTEGVDHAVAWDDSGVHDLNTLVPSASPDVTLEMADQVNDKGYIVGQSRKNGERRVFELIPIK